MHGQEVDGTLQLSEYNFATLKEFDVEQKQCIDAGRKNKYNAGIIDGNWQLSQFWYSQELALGHVYERITAEVDRGRIT